MREGLWRAARATYGRALDHLARLPAGAPLVVDATVACRLNAAACSLRAPEDGRSAAVAADVAAHCAAVLALDPKNATARLRRALASERHGAFDDALADLEAARRLVPEDQVPKVDARIDHARFLQRTR